MKELRIVIVSWNVEQLLERCLRSLPEACHGLDWECVVVDNASKDQSEEKARQVAQAIGGGRIYIVQSGANLGFAKACNLGVKHQAGEGANYYLFLNPDTECPPHSLAELVAVANARPKAGIIGPRLVYPDGTPQESVRRFPTFWDQAGIVLKLSHFFPRWKVFQHYYARDLDVTKEQSVDQVMGACFLVRRELIEKGYGFDERYFIWMEEVDFCKTAKKNGWEVLYIPAVTVVHHQGKSFAQEFQPKKQKYFTTSLKKYFAKWHPGWQSTVMAILAPLGQAAVWLLYASQQTWSKWLLLVLGVEIISATTLFIPSLMSLIAVVLAAVMAFIAWKRPWLAVSALLLELLIGSKGALLFVGEHPNTTSFRILLTGAFLFGWSLNVIASGSWKQRIAHWKKMSDDRMAYLILAGVIAYALIRGFVLGNGATVLKDANAWFFLVVLLPVLDIVHQHAEKLERHICSVLVIGLGWMATKTLLVSYIFSHGLGIAPYVYPWIRRTGIGEITLVKGNFFRVFFQSHVYAVVGLIGVVARVFIGKIERWRYLLAGCVAVLLLDLSRSFWMGTAAGLLMLIAVSYREMKPYTKGLRFILSSAVLGLVLAIGSVAIPLPPVDFSSIVSVFGSRTNSGEAAVVSRWNLLSALKYKISQHPLLGSGFGATVTFETKDPRIVNQTGGTYTTYAFEWGWLEHWVKFGIVGIPLMAWIVISLARRLWCSRYDTWIRAAGVACVFALAIIHIFTPYLNHPLGLTLLFFGEALIERSRRLIQ